MADPGPRPIAIVGAGATGLTAAYELTKHGRTVRLFEAAGRIGGPVQSERDEGWLIEAGPNTIQENSPEIRALIAELGLEPQKRFAQPLAKNRYVVKKGRPVPAPTSPPGLLTTPLFSLRAKLEILAELRQRPRQRPADVSLAEFIRSHFGRELVDYGLNPFVSGVYAGDPEKLSAQQAFPSLWAAEAKHGSILRAQIAAAKAKRRRGAPPGPPAIVSFTDGLAMLMRALAAHLPPESLRLNTRVERLLHDGDWHVTWSQDAESRTESFSHVLLALPSSSLARLRIGRSDERPLADLESIEYPPVSSTFLGYRRDQVQHPLDGFGLLVPQCERRQVLGVLFSSSLFPGRAPEGRVALTVMAGGAARPELGRAPLAHLLPVLRQELADLLGVTGEPVYVKHHAWARAIPQYNLGYGVFLDAMERFERDHPGLLIGGHVRDGIALTACLASGMKLARRALGIPPKEPDPQP